MKEKRTAWGRKPKWHILNNLLHLQWTTEMIVNNGSQSAFNLHPCPPRAFSENWSQFSLSQLGRVRSCWQLRDKRTLLNILNNIQIKTQTQTENYLAQNTDRAVLKIHREKLSSRILNKLMVQDLVSFRVFSNYYDQTLAVLEEKSKSNINPITWFN